MAEAVSTGHGQACLHSLIKRLQTLFHMFSRSNSRELLIDYQFLMPQKELVTIVSYGQTTLRNNPFHMFAGFSRQTWLLLALLYAMCVILYCLNVPSTGGVKLSTRIFLSCWDLIALALGTILLSAISLNPLRNPVILWTFGTYILRQLFSSDITALLLSPDQHWIDNFEQLRQTKFKILIEEKSSTEFFFTLKFPEMKSRLSRINYDEVSSRRVMYRLIKENAVMVVNRHRADSIRQFYGNAAFHVSREGYISTVGNYAIRKSLEWHIKHRLNRLFKSMFYSGVHLAHDRTFEINMLRLALRANQTVTTRAHLVKLFLPHHTTEVHSKVTTFLYIYSLGLSVALVCFLLELIVYRCGNKANQIIFG